MNRDVKSAEQDQTAHVLADLAAHPPHNNYMVAKGRIRVNASL